MKNLFKCTFAAFIVLAFTSCTNFPNEALINLWLLRGNVVTLIEDEQELYLEDIWNTTESTEGFSIYIQEHPDILPLMKNYAFISGAIAKQAIFLIREL